MLRFIVVSVLGSPARRVFNKARANRAIPKERTCWLGTFKLGFIEYNGGLKVNHSLLTVIVHD